MKCRSEASNNYMLVRLPKEDWERWREALEPIELHAGEVIFEVGSPLTHVFFPITAIISITRILLDGESIEVAMVGVEGIAGASTFLGNGITANRGVVLRSGKAYRVCGSWMKTEYENSPLLMQMMLQFTQALITQLSQVGACNCHHPLEQRLSRWLLMFADRAVNEPILCTQEQIANTLGVRRERVAKAASTLQKKGLVRYARGSIELLNKEALLAHTCECYAVINATYAPLFLKSPTPKNSFNSG